MWTVDALALLVNRVKARLESLVIPTRVSELTNDAGYITSEGTAAKVAHALTMQAPDGTGRTFDGSAAVTAGIGDLAYIENPIASAAEDTPAAWVALGQCLAYISNGSTLGYPSGVGHLINCANTNTTFLSQLWICSYSSGNAGKVYRRVGRAGYGWDSGGWTELVDAAGAASAAPVQSVNGQTGAVTVAVPTKTSELNNDSGYITAAEAVAPSNRYVCAGGTGPMGYGDFRNATNARIFIPMPNNAGSITAVTYSGTLELYFGSGSHAAITGMAAVGVQPGGIIVDVSISGGGTTRMPCILNGAANATVTATLS